MTWKTRFSQEKEELEGEPSGFALSQLIALILFLLLIFLFLWGAINL